MDNLLQFTIKLHDLVSSPLRKLSAANIAARNSFEQITKSVNNVKQAMGITGKSITEMTQRIDTLKARRNLLPDTAEAQIRAINKEINSLNGNIKRLETINGSKLKVWAKDAVNQLPFSGLIKNPLVMASAAAGYSLKQAMDVQDSKIKFSTLMGSDKAGDKMYSQLKGYADVTPYSKDDILKGGETLLNYGMNSKKILPTIKMLGDISGGSSERLQSLSLAFGQIYAKGHLAGQELLQMVNAGFNPLQEISKKTGKSMDELDSMMSKGKISVQMIEGALQSATGTGGRFNGMMERLSKSLQGQISTFMDEFNSIMADLGMMILPVVNSALNALSSVIKILANSIKSVVDWVYKNRAAFILITAAALGAFAAYKLYNTYQIITYLWSMRSSVAQAMEVKAKAINIIVTNGLTAAVNMLNIAFLKTPVGWLMLGLGALATYLVSNTSLFKKYTQQVDENSEAFIKNKAQADVRKKASEAISDQVARASVLISRIKELRGLEEGRKESVEAMKELNGISKEHFGIFKDIADVYKNGDSALTKYTESLFKHAEAMAAAEMYKDSFKEDFQKKIGIRNRMDELALQGSFFTAKTKTERRTTRGGYGADKITVYKDYNIDQKAAAEGKTVQYWKEIDIAGNIKRSVLSAFFKGNKDAKKLLSSPDGISGNTNTNNDGEKVSTSVVSGGPRVININGVTLKFADKIDIAAKDPEDLINKAEPEIKSMWLRVLNSGAKMQG